MHRNGRSPQFHHGGWVSPEIVEPIWVARPAAVGRHHNEIPQAVTKSLHQNAAVSPRTPAVSGEDQDLASARAQPPAGTPEQKSAKGAQLLITNLLNAEGDAGL